MKNFIISIFLLFSFGAFAKVNIKNITLTTQGKNAVLTIKTDGTMLDDPELSIRDHILQVAFKNGVVWPKIEKKVSIYNKQKRDTTLLAYQFDKNTARVRTLLPYKLTTVSDVDLRVKGKLIIATFPIKPQRKHSTIATIKQHKKAQQYDEGFLDQLLREQKTDNKQPEKIAVTAPATLKKVVEDKVKASQAAVAKGPTLLDTPKKEFNIVSYFGKFVAFLGVILLLFYGVVHLMRKGVLKKGKLGFLNDTNVITVLNTTYIAPKKSLMLVRVHQQTFLLSSTERGIEFLSEVNDTNGLLKEGEKEIAGSNFDTTLGTESLVEQKITLKEDITQSKPLDEGNAILNALKKTKKDQVRFSDQIKNRVKNLKPLQ